ncbi:MAG: sugar phosphate isomerase/epimerase [Planctomycetaceae bacterium]|nr:sugar phosphate isomerase/epimerase [Planctomycetaceae bacterium]
MIRSAITVSIVEQARKGPFVFHDDVPAACRTAADLGFDAVEVFAPSAEVIRALSLSSLLKEHQLALAAVGTGAGMVIHQLHLCDADESRRLAAREFIRAIIDAGADFGAPAIIGSMQGRWDALTDKATAIARLQDALEDLGTHAASRGVSLIYEPLNRYETNLAVTIEEGVALLKPLSTNNVKLLADLFHMNIEEACIADAIRTGGPHIGHVHFVDSNRQAAGRGHMNYAPIADALGEIGYNGYLSAEAFPIPDSLTTAKQTIESFRNIFPR